ncbi:MAG: B12-binding domain-containing radical SAM protein [Myxococcales bacterium]|nr:B12-binding domain-containing radical SAM protein [Myxococcales bacterium]
MKVLLLFPPQWTAAQPYFALATLNAQLRREGHEVEIRDLNLELVEHALSAPALKLAERRLSSEIRFAAAEAGLRLATLDHGEKLARAGTRLSHLESYRERRGGDFEAIVRAAGAVPGTLRDPWRYYEPKAHAAAMVAMDAALELYSASYFPSAVRWNDFAHPAVPFNLAPLAAFCADRQANPFVRFFEARLEELLGSDGGLFAISINSFSQVVPGLTLAMMLRKELSKRQGRPHLSLGGNFFSRLREALSEKPLFFSTYADSLVIGEGERPIVKLAQAIGQGGGERLKEVPNLLYLPEGQKKVCCNAEAPNFRMGEMAFQELAGFPLERYLAPDRVVCLRASKGCYWGQCSFCDSYYGLANDSVQVERVVAEMRHLEDAYGVRHFEFVDQCISPQYLALLSDALLEADLSVRWFCNARTEAGFTSELLERIHRAGNTMIMWGVESGSQRLLKLMRKGVSAEGRLEILRRAAQAGIWNFAYVFFGYPSETHEEAQATIDLIRQNVDIIHAYGRSVFTLGKHSPLVKDPQKSGILSIVEDKQELSTNLHYEVAQGIQSRELAEVSRRCNEQCRAAYGDPLWMALRSREALHLYLAHHGRDFVQHYRFNEDSAQAEAEFIF